MRKISHINLGNFLLNQDEVLEAKRKCFVIGNVLPDCLPTFIYIRHNINKTLKKVEQLLEELSELSPDTYRFWIKLGCIMHYIADYFTYPHTKLFDEGFWKHNSYEKILKDRLKEHLRQINLFNEYLLKNTEDFITFIKEEQKSYFKEKINHKNDVELDIKYIEEVCFTIFENICCNKQLATI